MSSQARFKVIKAMKPSNYFLSSQAQFSFCLCSTTCKQPLNLSIITKINFSILSMCMPVYANRFTIGIMIRYSCFGLKQLSVSALSLISRPCWRFYSKQVFHEIIATFLFSKITTRSMPHSRNHNEVVVFTMFNQLINELISRCRIHIIV
ncbi:hypothetical protein EDF67_102485 [Sphingobacterium sp. JUb78]|nr:hypothetical protein EDF67_102485 [Sphingobacterium sp. JUb78]